MSLLFGFAFGLSYEFEKMYHLQRMFMPYSYIGLDRND